MEEFIWWYILGTCLWTLFAICMQYSSYPDCKWWHWVIMLTCNICAAPLCVVYMIVKYLYIIMMEHDAKGPR